MKGKNCRAFAMIGVPVQLKKIIAQRSNLMIYKARNKTNDGKLWRNCAPFLIFFNEITEDFGAINSVRFNKIKIDIYSKGDLCN